MTDRGRGGGGGRGRGGPPMTGTVVSKEWRTPSLVRLVLGGEGLDAYNRSEWSDEYVILLFPAEGVTDPEARPRTRRMTTRHWDPDGRELTIDIVAHGDVGYAGRWAQAAGPGDTIQLRGPGGGYRPDPDADWFLFVGDESALPAIEASIEAVPANRPVEVVLVTDDEAHEVEIPDNGATAVTWVHRMTADSPGEVLLGAVESLEWRDGNVDIFVHGEASEVRAIRRHLVVDRGVDKDDASISPYWRRDFDDEAWREVKRQWLADQEQDV